MTTTDTTTDEPTLAWWEARERWILGTIEAWEGTDPAEAVRELRASLAIVRTNIARLREAARPRRV